MSDVTKCCVLMKGRHTARISTDSKDTQTAYLDICSMRVKFLTFCIKYNIFYIPAH